MSRIRILLTAALCLGLPSLASASIVSIIAGATLIEDFQFNDAAGTAYTAAINSAGTGNLWNSDTDLAGMATNGSGALNASTKANNNFGSTLVDTQDQASGRYLATMALTWSFRSALDSSEPEELRLGFVNSGIADVTAEIGIKRTASGLQMSGSALGTGSTALAAQALNGGSLEQIARFIAVLLVDLDTDTYQAHFSADDGATFAMLGVGSLDPNRGIDQLRLVLNNDLSNDNVLIDRITMARVEASAVPEPSTGLLALGGIALAHLARRRKGTPD